MVELLTKLLEIGEKVWDKIKNDKLPKNIQRYRDVRDRAKRFLRK